MATVEAFDAFEDRLQSQWTQTPLAFENDGFTTPDVSAPFVYVEIFGDEYPQETMGAPGSNVFRETGITYLHVMVPNNTGTRQARAYAKALTNLFREQQIDGLSIDNMSIGGGEPGKDFPNYWAMTVTLWWHRRDITSI